MLVVRVTSKWCSFFENPLLCSRPRAFLSQSIILSESLKSYDRNEVEKQNRSTREFLKCFCYENSIDCLLINIWNLLVHYYYFLRRRFQQTKLMTMLNFLFILCLNVYLYCKFNCMHLHLQKWNLSENQKKFSQLWYLSFTSEMKNALITELRKQDSWKMQSSKVKNRLEWETQSAEHVNNKNVAHSRIFPSLEEKKIG